MTLYDFNRQIYNKLPSLEDNELLKAKPKLENYLASKKHEKYFMMLNHEKKYYTIYTYKEGNFLPAIMAQTMIDVAKTLGKLKAIEVNDNMVEFWISDDSDNCYLYAMFPYSKGVIEV